MEKNLVLFDEMNEMGDINYFLKEEEQKQDAIKKQLEVEKRYALERKDSKISKESMRKGLGKFLAKGTSKKI